MCGTTEGRATVVSFGTCVRARADRSELARPPIVDIDFWNTCSLLEKRRLVEEHKATHSVSTVASRLRAFAVREPNQIYSTFPPDNGPPPSAMIRWVVCREAEKEVGEDHDTVGCSCSDLRRPPEVIGVSCVTIIAYDSAIAGLRDAEADLGGD